MSVVVGKPAISAATVVERELSASGHRLIAGVDEAGRGAWAGPLVAAAVILAPDLTRRPVWCRGVRDSKLAPPAERERLARAIRRSATAVGVGVVEPEVIDLIGLTAAGHLAMRRALRTLHLVPEFVLVDAFTIPGLAVPQRAIIHGDRLCLSIAAASIIAKTHRDALMRELDTSYPHYGLAGHKGYGTGQHQRGLESLGASRIHRYSYRPVAPFVP